MVSIIEKARSTIKLFYGSLLLLLVIVSSCTDKPGDDPGPMIPFTNQGVIRPLGEIAGVATSKIIGAEGGTIVSADGGIEVTIPAGALATNTTISVQPITNTNQCGEGTAYRLTPHGQQFNKPAIIKFHYTAEQVPCVEALGISYQDNIGRWKAVGGVAVDAVNKTITAKTTHFSDWSFFEAFELLPNKSFINPGEKVTLKLTHYLGESEELMLVPLWPDGTEKFLTEGKELQSKYIDEWKLVGEGTLTPQSVKAEYTAPAKIPAKNPATISVRIKNGTTAIGLLIARVYVAPEGVSLRVNGGEWITMPTAVAQFVQGTNSIMSSQANTTYPFVSILWKDPVVGEKLWALGDIIGFSYKPNKDSEYHHFYISGENAVASPGSLDITQSGNVGDYVIGTFTVNKSGWLSSTATPKVASIEGVIRVKRLK
ncbi:hypothetical protein D3C72_363000 [compost metagenome]